VLCRVRAEADGHAGALIGRLLPRVLLHSRGAPPGALAATDAGKPYIVRVPARILPPCSRRRRPRARSIRRSR
jgi:hypothetical protein